MKRNLIFFFYLIGLGLTAQSTDSLRKLIGKPGLPDTLQVKVYFSQANDLLYSDLDSAYIITLIGKKLAEKINYQKFIGEFTSLEGVYYKNKGEFPKALEKYIAALKIKEKINNRRGMTIGNNDLGILYKTIKNYSLALSHYRVALSLSREMKMKLGEALILNNIGTIYQETKDSAKANLDSALYYYELSRKKAEEINDANAISTAYCNMAQVYGSREQYAKAVYYFTHSLAIDSAENNIPALIENYTNIGGMYNMQKKFDLALTYMRKGEKLAKENDMKVLLKENYSSMADVLYRMGKPTEAYDYVRKMSALQEEITNEASQEAIAEMRVKFETEKKEYENLKLQKENAEKDLHLSHTYNIIFVIGAALIIVLISSVFVYLRNKLKQKQKFDAELLKQQELRNRAIIEAEEKERRRIARDLHDGVGQMLSAAKLNLSNLEGYLKNGPQNQWDMIKNSIELVDDSVREVRQVSHNLMPNALIQFGLVRAVRDFISKISSSETLKIDLEIIGLNERLEPTTETVLYRVLQELVNNVIKHSEANHLSIQVIRHDKELTVMLEDNGKGFDTILVTEAKGIGLANIISRINFLNGNVNFDSSPGRGTTVTIEIPL
ncbi:MAG: tetratricopeptide repeat protein [Bacteroidia bacterium]|nr:tetratricopeptide repeat protein [Bacteroidia bacterium]